MLDRQSTFKGIGAFNGFADTLLSNDRWRRSFNVYEKTIAALYEACKPEILSDKERPLVYVFQYLRGVVDGKIDEQDVDALRIRIGELLDQSVVTIKGNLQGPGTPRYELVKRGRQWDLRNIDIEKLRAEFQQAPYKNIEIESEQELELFDVLKQEKMTKAEEQQVKLAAKDLLRRLLEEQPKVLVAGWYKDAQSQRRVRAVVEETLDQKLPESYDRMRFKSACDSLFDLIVNRAINDSHWSARIHNG